MGCCVTIPQANVGMVERWGKYVRTAGSGFNCLNCFCGEQVVGMVSLRIQQLEVPVETKTKDNVFITCTLSVQYQAILEKTYEAYYKLTDPQAQMKSYVFDVVRASIPKLNLDEVFEEKEEIAVTVKKTLEKSMGDFGFIIVQALVTDIDPASNVKKAMNEINAAQRIREAANDKAEAEKILVVKAAEADAESKYLAGVGIARQRKAIVDGLRDSVMHFAEGVEGTNPKEVLDLVLVTQYFDTLKDIGAQSKASTIFIPHAPGAVGDVSAQLRQGFMEAESAKTK